MLKSAAAKLAHNSTIPALAGNKALRPLQDLITAEKAIITSLGRLSLHFSQASEALRIWGHGEGDDLSDTLGASTKLLLAFSLSLTKFSTYEQTIREHMKAVRTQEENLDRFRQRRKSVASKADSAERKLNKMDPAHKDAAAQSNMLELLRDSIRELDSEIMTGEAKLGDLKRTATKAWMTLKFGGLEECCRKGLIAAEAGKRIMAELPQETTSPGLPRSIYMGNVRTEAYVADALRALGEVSIDTSASSGRVQLSLDTNYPDSSINVMPSPLPDNESALSFGRGGLPGDGDGSSQYRNRYSNDAPRPLLGEGVDYGRLPATSQADEHGVFQPEPDIRRFQTFNSRKPPPSSSFNTISRDDGPSLSQPIVSPTSAGGRFTTFPVKGRRQDSAPPMIAEPLEGSRSTFSDMEQAPPQGDAEEAAPMYEAVVGTRTPPLRPPPGAAPPALPYASPYGGYDPGLHDSDAPFVPDNMDEKEFDSQLPYMTGDRRVPLGSRPLPMPRLLAQADREAATIEAPSASIEGDSTTPTAAQVPMFEERPLTPPPAVDDLDDERALNAAAAREVSRELDSLMYHPPTVMPRASPPQTSVSRPLSIPEVTSSPRSSSDSVIQPSSPFARTRGRVPGSPQAPRSSAEQPPTSNVSSSPPLASVSSSPIQQAHRPPSSIAVGQSASASPSLSSVSSPPFRTPPEIPPSPTLAQRSLPLPQSPAVTHSHSPMKTPPHPRAGSGMISVAAFRRPVASRTSDAQPSPGSRDVSPLSIKKRDLRSSPNARRTSDAFGPLPPMPGAPPPEPDVSSLHAPHQEDEFDYISAYYNSGGDEEARTRSSILR